MQEKRLDIIMNIKICIGILGILLTISAWSLESAEHVSWLNRIVFPSYNKAQQAFQALNKKNSTISRGEPGFFEVAAVVKSRISGKNIPDIVQIKGLEHGTVFVNTANGLETQTYNDLRVFFSDGRSFEGRLRKLSDYIQEFYYSTNLRTYTTLLFIIGVLLSVTSLIIDNNIFSLVCKEATNG
jgi:hypothetical protein